MLPDRERRGVSGCSCPRQDSLPSLFEMFRSEILDFGRTCVFIYLHECKIVCIPQRVVFEKFSQFFFEDQAMDV